MPRVCRGCAAGSVVGCAVGVPRVCRRFVVGSVVGRAVGCAVGVPRVCRRIVVGSVVGRAVGVPPDCGGVCCGVCRGVCRGCVVGVPRTSARLCCPVPANRMSRKTERRHLEAHVIGDPRLSSLRDRLPSKTKSTEGYGSSCASPPRRKFSRTERERETRADTSGPCEGPRVKKHVRKTMRSCKVYARPKSTVLVATWFSYAMSSSASRAMCALQRRFCVLKSRKHLAVSCHGTVSCT